MVTPDLSLHEVLATAHVEFQHEQENPPPLVLANIRRHGVDLWQPARDLVGPMRVTSGWRCPALNRKVGGASGSYHLDGLATDNIPLEMDLLDAFARITASALPYDQAIFEVRLAGRENLTRWMHLGSPRHGADPRRQVLMKVPGSYFEPFSRSEAARWLR